MDCACASFAFSSCNGLKTVQMIPISIGALAGITKTRVGVKFNGSDG